MHAVVEQALGEVERADAELAPDRPTNDPEDLASAVQEEEAREQSGI